MIVVLVFKTLLAKNNEVAFEFVEVIYKIMLVFFGHRVC